MGNTTVDQRNWIFQMCARRKSFRSLPPDTPLLLWRTVLPPIVNHLFHFSWEELVQIHKLEQLMDHTVCFISPRVTFSPGSSGVCGVPQLLAARWTCLPHTHRTAPLCQQALQQNTWNYACLMSNKAAAYLRVHFGSTGAPMLLSEFFFRCRRNDTLYTFFFQGLTVFQRICGCWPWFSKPALSLPYFFRRTGSWHKAQRFCH